MLVLWEGRRDRRKEERREDGKENRRRATGGQSGICGCGLIYEGYCSGAGWDGWSCVTKGVSFQPLVGYFELDDMVLTLGLGDMLHWVSIAVFSAHNEDIHSGYSKWEGTSKMSIQLSRYLLSAFMCHL